MIAKAAPIGADPWERLIQEADQLSPELRNAFLDVLEQLRDRPPIEELAAALERGDVRAVQILLLGEPSQSIGYWAALAAAAKKAVLDVGIGTFTGYELAIKPLLGPQVQIVFDIADPRALQAAQRNAFELVRQVDAYTREGLRTYVIQQLNAGINPRAIIPQLVGTVGPNGRTGGILGLTARQSQAVLNFRRALERNDGSALQRQLRDRRFDHSVRSAAANARPLDPERVDQMVRRYEDRMLAYRAETIARNESAKALAAGKRAGWDQAIAKEVVHPSDLTKRWVTARDERVRPANGRGFGIEGDHRQMEGQTVAYNKDFVAPDTGERTWGPPAGVGCRCIGWIRPKLGA